jgi:hypothetical protein
VRAWPTGETDGAPASGSSWIYLAGLVGEGDAGELVVMRFDRNGHLEKSFGRGGRLATPFSRREQPLAGWPLHS